MQNTIVSPFLFDVRFCLTTLLRSRLIEATLKKRGASASSNYRRLTRPASPDDRPDRAFSRKRPPPLARRRTAFLFDADFLYPEPTYRQSKFTLPRERVSSLVIPSLSIASVPSHVAPLAPAWRTGFRRRMAAPCTSRTGRKPCRRVVSLKSAASPPRGVSAKHAGSRMESSNGLLPDPVVGLLHVAPWPLQLPSHLSRTDDRGKRQTSN